jgi:hypothetical protein
MQFSEFASRRRASIAFIFAAFLALFLIANRAAYEGYFSGDDLAAKTKVDIRVDPVYEQGSVPLGIAVEGFGFK